MFADAKSTNVMALVLNNPFKSIFGHMDGQTPDFLQILDVNYEGFNMKEINVIMEYDTDIRVLRLKQVRFKAYMIF